MEGAKARAYIGTSGWSYDAWRDSQYHGRPQSEWLSLCAQRFSAIEVDASFYRLQRRETFQRWRAGTPADFRFAIKANRYLTPQQKARRAPAGRRAGAQPRIGSARKAGRGFFGQLPHDLHRNLAKLEGPRARAEALRSVRHAIEFRHPSWFDDEVAACLQKHRLAVCQSDAADWPMWNVVTTDLYTFDCTGRPPPVPRLSESEREAGPGASGAASARGATCMSTRQRRVGHAPRNASRLIELIARP